VRELGEQGVHLFLQRIGYSARLAIAPPGISLIRR
jgi:hypothetical protein